MYMFFYYCNLFFGGRRQKKNFNGVLQAQFGYGPAAEPKLHGAKE